MRRDAARSRTFLIDDRIEDVGKVEMIIKYVAWGTAIALRAGGASTARPGTLLRVHPAEQLHGVDECTDQLQRRRGSLKN